MIAVTNDLISSVVTDLDTDCDTLQNFVIMPPLGKSDHDIIYAEINVRPNRMWMCTPHRKVFVFRKADWDGIKRKLNALFEKMQENAKHEFQRDGITICTTFTPFKPENARLLVRKNDIIIDIRVMYDHIKGTTLILSKNISLLVTIKGV